jgi:hypothetical protein
MTYQPEDEIRTLPVHLKGSDIPLGGGPAKRKRRALRTNTWTLTAANPVQQVLPQADTRTEAWITAATEVSPPVLYMSTSQAGAQAAAGGAAQVVGTDTSPFPVNTTDAVWVYAATGYPVTVSAVAIYDEAE